jgi:hypothetical protein
MMSLCLELVQNVHVFDHDRTDGGVVIINEHSLATRRHATAAGHANNSNKPGPATPSDWLVSCVVVELCP